jgi:hypothetical protein
MPVISEIPQTDSCQSNVDCRPHFFVKQRTGPIVKRNAPIFELEFLDVALNHRNKVIYSSQMSTGVLLNADLILFRTMYELGPLKEINIV